jgi:hypothetical protein
MMVFIWRYYRKRTLPSIWAKDPFGPVPIQLSDHILLGPFFLHLRSAIKIYQQFEPNTVNYLPKIIAKKDVNLCFPKINVNFSL